MVKEADREPYDILVAEETVTTGPATERLALTWEQRRKSRLRAMTTAGTPVGLFLPRGTVLLDGSLVRASDSRIIGIVAAPEDVSTISTPDAVLLARVAYHLGSRHVRVQVGPGFLRYRHDRATDELVSQLGADVTVEEAPFEPERGTRDHAHDDDMAS